MEYRRLAPDPALAGIVEHYWVVRAPAPPEELRAVLIPDGRATVQLCLGAPGRRLRVGSGTAETNADVFLPVTAEPYVLAQTGASHYVGVQLSPWGAAVLWPDAGRDPRAIDGLSPGRPAAVALARDPAPVLDRWLRAELARGVGMGAVPALVRDVVGRIDADPGDASVAALALAAGVAPSTLYRAFVRWVGVSPKVYTSIRRYDGFASTLLARSHGDTGAMLAAAAGYADEAHAAREFRRHTGMGAAAFRRRLDGIAALMFDDVAHDSFKPGPGDRP